MQEILSRVEFGIGWITINRPNVLNALTLDMIKEVLRVIDKWEKDPSVRLVVMQGAGDRAFCAGGDLKTVYGTTEFDDIHYRTQYTLDARINGYSKPCVSIINGITMGGGLGLSINSSHRIVTEKSVLGIPETGIGFFPDVGATHFLCKCPGVVGLYLGLTGTIFKAADALWAGMATHYIPSSEIDSFIEELSRKDDLDTVLKKYNQLPAEKGFLEDSYSQIERHFNKNSIIEIFDSLKEDPSEFAQASLKSLMTKSPTSLAVAFRQIKVEGPTLSFKDRMKMEFRLSQRFSEGHDFREGIRAIIIDKDKNPIWIPADIKDVKGGDVDKYFYPLGNKELIL